MRSSRALGLHQHILVIQKGQAFLEFGHNTFHGLLPGLFIGDVMGGRIDGHLFKSFDHRTLQGINFTDLFNGVSKEINADSLVLFISRKKFPAGPPRTRKVPRWKSTSLRVY